ncbi:GAF and ANTAR domain-containing protein [Micromonospora sp. CPCC 206060]|uniref:GAF and ANTAR domain-containing protein n=1 Tax=Micromonospora sp. CPCC 206060 TaxID=3122406 RepID=UPI002FF3081D
MRLQTQRDSTGLGVLETAALLRELTAGLIAVDDFDEALRRLVRIGREAVDGVTGCGFTVLRAGSAADGAASDSRLAELDGIAHGPDSPPMAAIRRREMVLAEDLLAEERWPVWTQRAQELGVRSVLSAPLDIDDQVIGAVNLYGDQPRSLTAHQQLTAMLLAEHAGLLLAAVRDRARQAALAAEPAEPLIDGEVVAQAVGVIMTQRGCPAPEALQVLRSAATALSIPLREVAERLLATVVRTRET